MKILDCNIKNDVDLYCIGDLHVGTIAFSEKLFLKAVQDIKRNPKGLVVGLGDYVEGRSPDHPYFQMDVLDLNTPLAYKQAEVVIKYLTPIKDKILVLLEGNHDRYSRQYLGLVENIICKELGVPFGTWTCLINFKTKNGNSFVGHFAHGSDRRSPVRSQSPIPARQQVNEKLSLINILSAPGFQSVINCVGHYHRIISYKASSYSEIRLLVKDGDLKESYAPLDEDDAYGRYYASSGAWVRSYVNNVSTYSERAMFKATSIGMVCFKIRKGKVVDVEELIY